MNEIDQEWDRHPIADIQDTGMFDSYLAVSVHYGDKLQLPSNTIQLENLAIYTDRRPLKTYLLALNDKYQ